MTLLVGGIRAGPLLGRLWYPTTPGDGQWAQSRKTKKIYLVTLKLACAVSVLPCWRGWEITPVTCSVPIVPLKPKESELTFAVSFAVTA